MSSPPILGYWDIRGLAQPIRNLLVLADVQFEDRTYRFGPGTTKEELDSINKHWLKDKLTLGLDFPNLPYWLDGDVRLTQSTAILKYLARKHGLIAEDNVTLAKQEMLEQQLLDYVNGFAMNVAYSDKYLDVKHDFIKKTLPENLNALTRYLGDYEWFTGQFSYVDILAYEVLDTFRLFSPRSFDKYPELNGFIMRFENLPKINEYQSRSKYKNWQLFTPVAKWGYGNIDK